MRAGLDPAARLQGALAAAVADGLQAAALMAALRAGYAAGLSRRALYDGLHGVYQVRLAARPPLSEAAQADVEAVLDRLWGFCPQAQLLFPALPVLGGDSPG